MFRTTVGRSRSTDNAARSDKVLATVRVDTLLDGRLDDTALNILQSVGGAGRGGMRAAAAFEYIELQLRLRTTTGSRLDCSAAKVIDRVGQRATIINKGRSCDQAVVSGQRMEERLTLLVLVLNLLLNLLLLLKLLVVLGQ